MISRQVKVLQNRRVGPNHYVIRMERGDISFDPGQNIHVGPRGQMDRREYSIYSSPDDDYIEILLSLQAGGELSPLICRSRPGDLMNIEGPFGGFSLNSEDRKRPVYMIATGTGISPFRSICRSFRALRYHVYHGIRDREERLEWESFASGCYTDCTSRSDRGLFQGRVTSRLETLSFESHPLFMLCGNSNMIYDAYSILHRRGIPRSDIRAEIYF